MMSVWNTTTNWICWYPRRSAALFYSQVIVWSFKISSLVIQNFIKWCYPFHVEGQEPYLRHYYDQLSLKNCQLSEKCLEVSSLREGCSYTSQVILTSLLLSAWWEAQFCPGSLAGIKMRTLLPCSTPAQVIKNLKNHHSLCKFWSFLCCFL